MCIRDRGIGLCRTEHMFFAEDRIAAVREMICARTVEERKTALAKVEPFQEADFTAMSSGFVGRNSCSGGSR